MMTTRKYEETRPHDLPQWLEEFKDNLVDESVPEHRDASSSSHELLSEPRAKVVSGRHSTFTHFPKTEIATSAWETKLQGPLTENALVRSCPERKFLVI